MLLKQGAWLAIRLGAGMLRKNLDMIEDPSWQQTSNKEVASKITLCITCQ